MAKKVRMLKTERGSPDGIHINVYKKDKDYTITDSLAHTFVKKMGVAMEVIHSYTEEKMMSEAPSNKSVSKMRVDPEPVTVRKPRIRIGRNRKT